MVSTTILSNDTTISELFLQYGADVNKCATDGSNALYYACLLAKIDLLKLIIKHNFNFSKYIDVGIPPLNMTPFHCCFMNVNRRKDSATRLKCLKFLFKCAKTQDIMIDMYRTCSDGGNAFSLLAKYLINKLDYLNETKSGNPDLINQVTPKGTLLYGCALGGDLEIIQLLWDKSNGNMDLNLTEPRQGRSPLFAAAQENYINIIKWLLSQPKCDVNLQTSFGITPLMKAIQKKYHQYRLDCEGIKTLRW